MYDNYYFTHLHALMCMSYEQPVLYTLTALLASVQNGLDMQLPLFLTVKGVKNVTTAFECWQTNRLK